MKKAGVNHDTLAGWIFLAPFLVSLSVFFLWAIVRTAWFSLTDYDLFGTPSFIGLENYVRLVSDDLFLLALRNSISFAAIVTTLQTVLALLLAVLVNSAARAKGLVRTVFYFPSIMSSAAMTLIFLWLFQRQGLMTSLVGNVINLRWIILSFVATVAGVQVLQVVLARRKYAEVGLFDPFFLILSVALGLAGAIVIRLGGWLPVYDEQLLISWLNTKEVFLFMPRTLWSVALMNIFTTVPTLMLLFLAGLQSIPGSLYDAAKMDGASSMQSFFSVTLPSLTPVTFAVVTLGLIGTLQMFDQVAILGAAAPLESRITLAYYTYYNTFPPGGSPNIGMASAAALTLGLLTLVIVFVQRQFGIKERIG
ncbi:MAG TPA: sugar ABC transporter permease [Devosia sp.]|nr:sugar ABC transporter permease [Devosia sp.]